MPTFAERERLAYITNSPEAALLVILEEAFEEMGSCGHSRHHEHEMQIDELATEIELKDLVIEQLDARTADLLSQLEALDIELANLTETVSDRDAEIYCLTDELAALRNPQ